VVEFWAPSGLGRLTGLPSSARLSHVRGEPTILLRTEDAVAVAQVIACPACGALPRTDCDVRKRRGDTLTTRRIHLARVRAWMADGLEGTRSPSAGR